ncbi:MAG: tetratricopeptide repeat protein [Gaiellaceae bacterium]
MPNPAWKGTLIDCAPSVRKSYPVTSELVGARAPEAAGDLVGQSSLANNAGVALYYAGKWTDAVTEYRRSGELSERAGDVVNTARSTNNEAEIVSDQGHLEEARRLLEDALRVWRAASYPIGVALATSNLGRVAARSRRFDDAHGLLDQAASAFREIGATSFVHENDARRLECLVLEGRYAEALEVAGATLDDVRPLGATPLLAGLERLAGYAVVQSRQPLDAACARFDASLAVGRELGAQYEVALTLRALADTKCMDDPEAARRESEELLEQLGVASLATPPLP